MKPILLVLLVLATIVPAAELGPAAPSKAPGQHTAPPPDPVVRRQGGDTIADAVTIEVPYVGTGTTIGYTDDYDEVCPYTGSTSPDVVYRLDLSYDTSLTIDLFGSTYDTKVYVYDEALELVACNDDYYPDYVSRLDVNFTAGLYYVVIDGYGGDAGAYELSIVQPFGWIECPPGAQLENEPPLVENYVDAHNGGCNSLDEIGTAPFQAITQPFFCGVAGWYEYDGDDYRDTDWFTIEMPATGVLTVTGDAEYLSYMFELGPQDCDAVGVLQQLAIGPYLPGTMLISGEPGSTVWFWVGSATFENPYGPYENEYPYLLQIPEVVAVQASTWTAVKGLFD